MGGGFFLAGGADADVAGFFAERGERRGAQVAHAALHAADERVDRVVEGAADFFKGFDALGGGFAGGVVFVVAIAGGAAGFHRGEAAHAAVLFIEFAADFHDLAGRFAAAGQEAAADDGVGEGEGFHDVAGFGDATVGQEFDVFVFGGGAGDVEGGELGDADAGDDARGADGAGALADFDGIGAAVGEEGDAGGAGNVAGDDGEVGESGADEFDHVADAGGVAVGGRDGDGVDGFFDEGADVGEDFFAVERSAWEAHGREGGADNEAEAGVAGGFAAGFGLGGDALDVGSGDEAFEAVVGADDEHFVDADVGGEEAVGGADGVFGGSSGGLGDEGGARGHDLGDAFGAVAVFDDVTREEAGEAAGGVDDGEGGEGKILGLDHFEDVADEELGGDGDGVLDEAVDVAFHAGDFFHLFLGRHVVVDEAEAAVEGHRDGHVGLGDGVHVRGDNRNVEPEGVGEGGGGVGGAGENLGVESGEGNVVEGERGGEIGAEEGVGGEVKFGVGGGGDGGANGARGGAGGGRGTRRGTLGNLGHDCRERSRCGRGKGNGKVGRGARRVPTEHTEDTEGGWGGEKVGRPHAKGERGAEDEPRRGGRSVALVGDVGLVVGLFMRVRFQYRRYRLAFRTAVRTAHGVWSEREGVLVKISDEAGNAGLGEAACLPWFGTETVDEAEAACAKFGEWIEEATLAEVPERLVCLRNAMAAARGELEEQPANANGTERRAKDHAAYLGVAALLPAGRAVLAALGPKAEAGFRIFKWKVGVGDVADELGLLDDLCAVLPSGAKLRLDANGAWDRRKAERWLERCAERPVEFVEQPVAAEARGAEDVLRGLAEDWPTPIALDESLAGDGDVERWIGAGWRGVWVIKTGLLGDVARTLARLEKAQAKVVFSSALETAVGARAALQWAFGWKGEARALGFGVWPLFQDAGCDGPYAAPFIRPADVARIDGEAVWNAIS